ncbi:apoptosis-associated speck-like protein containing a CARD [Amia ocellicauda]|uniref:apoptosis-associated speck-like protein containing a CARD n=1 Tax=Amia ocellicauda TaxID=2972642 RepID=UPI003464A5AF|nr:ASC protein [Amia calva]
MNKTIKDHIMDILDDLDDSGLKRFKNKLSDRGGEPKIPKGRLEKADSIDIANLLVSYFTESKAGAVTIEVLQAINLNAEADQLRALTS